MTAIRDTEVLRHSRLLGVGVHRPERSVPNTEIAGRTGLDPDWIERRSGIRSRRYAGPEETLPAMATAAAEKALAAAGVSADRIDTVIVATITSMEQMPAVAVEVARRLGADRAAAFDVSAACAGFCHALALAGDQVRMGRADHVLVIGAERMTDILDHEDGDTAFLFADGAGAVVVGPSHEPGIGPVVWRADGTRNAALRMTAPWHDGTGLRPEARPAITMSGWKVFRWATNELVPAARKMLDLAGVTVDDLDAFIPHQANMLITDHVVDQLGLPAHTAVARDIVTSGNSSAASIPLAMEELLAGGKAPSGGLALLIGFGAGLVYAGQVVRLP
ncbi:beta-ketoacyl-ACP synthase 3 [Streptomyces albidoflavus]|uniref:Putative 3-keto-acyl-ACP synthase n=2 Tax=Streptomyces TaxID=1883 RepID=Q2MGB8_STRGR|nr:MULTISPECIES: beta-ketoacyl-ACP synthase 3 [Streptomyces]AAQ08929.1 putative 3-keto-acyl-ACP synthase [Streptomyces griseus]MYX53134.1 beta-ketoacyl-ACP synthase III [Streptomyces sp. SID8385]SCD85191.1 3-oxoacyl-[acyl-carrier-protein] synthase-3 [Streptomyces sp. IgraMP-1]MBV7649558.1 beta-ketoacyl-ACP synthase 3 [Streptomyces albidoflavus]MBV7711023.1 beta-ketoacyl-ACP synthase 3 [Streptomyces albidoflavus]